MALNVTVQSYNGRLDYGLIACRRALPDVNELADDLLAEHRTLLELARARTPAAELITAAKSVPTPAKTQQLEAPAPKPSPAKTVRAKPVPSKVTARKSAKRATAVAA